MSTVTCKGENTCLTVVGGGGNQFFVFCVCNVGCKTAVGVICYGTIVICNRRYLIVYLFNFIIIEFYNYVITSETVIIRLRIYNALISKRIHFINSQFCLI